MSLHHKLTDLEADGVVDRVEISGKVPSHPGFCSCSDMTTEEGNNIGCYYCVPCPVQLHKSIRDVVVYALYHQCVVRVKVVDSLSEE